MDIPNHSSGTLVVRNLGTVAYLDAFNQMKAFTDARTDVTPDEFWLLEHPAVFTLGQTGKREHLLDPGDIEIVQSDRGGQVTYHGPGQIVGYLLWDLARQGMGVRDLVSGIENAIINLLSDFDLRAQARREAPGVYVSNAKIAALGLRVRKGRCYHGLSLNVDMDLSPFERINPCGYEGLAVTSLRALGVDEDLSSLGSRLVKHVERQFSYHASWQARA
ncbi:MAG: lipoyl(octanoyl) transferase LipB [Pseudomonadales bacterium]